MTNDAPRSGQPVYETPAEQRFRAEMTRDGFSPEEVDAAIAETRPPVTDFVAASNAAATGALPYGLGFIAYVPIPVVSLIVTGIVMAAVYPSQRRKSALAAENARYAANWGLTLVAAMILMLVLMFSFVALLDGRGAQPLTALLIFFVAAAAHLVVVINGLVKTRRGEVFKNPIAIPFLR